MQQIVLLSIVAALALWGPSSDQPQTSDRLQTAPHHTIVPLPNFWEQAHKMFNHKRAAAA